MQSDEKNDGLSRRDMLKLIGGVAGGVALHQVMGSMGYAAESTYKGPLTLEGKGKGESIVILGAGLAGMVAALELQKAGYKVSVLEYRERAGGRCWTLHSGEEYTELGGAKQVCRFDKGDYINPGPWRIPYHHYGVLDYCRLLGVEIEPFTVLNMNAYYHSRNAFDGKPQRIRHVISDMQGYVSELLAKATNQDALDGTVTKEDKEKLLEALRNWGALDKDFRYTKGIITSQKRGFDVDPGGGLMPDAVYSQPLDFKDLLSSKLWRFVSQFQAYEYHQSIFQPVGGIEGVAKGFAKKVGNLITYNTKVSKIAQDDKGVTITCTDTKTGKERQVKADWCFCTIPLSVLSQMEVQASDTLKAAIDAVPYETGFKTGIQFKRRFWEEDERIFGGITYTDTPLRNISYPMQGINKGGKGVVLAAYTFGPDSYKFSGMTVEDRQNQVLDFFGEIHPQAKKEFDNAVSVGWHRVPWTHGCHGMWTTETREKHYKNLCEIDGRLILAGEHASHIPAWLEGAVLSGMDAVERLHKRIQSK